MQVDEEVKTDLDIGGYSDDSEDEREKKDEKKKADYLIKLTPKGDQVKDMQNATLLVLNGLHAQTMAKIMYGSDWEQIGEVIKHKLSDEDDVQKNNSDDKDTTIVDLYALPNVSFFIALPDVEKMSGSSVNPTVSKLFSTFTSIQKVCVLSSLYKTKYPNPDELAGMSDGKVPMKTHKTSFVPADEAAWLNTQVGSPAHFMAATGGLGAACLVECEMTGKAGYQITMITDSHYVSTESMVPFEPIMTRLGLQSDFSQIQQKSGFRDILREANQRGNTIFC